MAEGHAIHALARRLDGLSGQRLRSTSPDGSSAAGLLDGLVLTSATAHGKHLLATVDGGALTLHVHLGMDGNLVVDDGREAPVFLQNGPRRRGTVAWRAVTESATVELTAPTVCEVLDPAGVAALHARLGPDPLRPQDDPADALGRIQRSRRSVAALLVDQAVIAGIGNTYRCELLHRARLDPFRAGRDLTEAEFGQVWRDAGELMRLGMQVGWIVSDPGQVAEARRLLAAGDAVPRWPKVYAVYLRAGDPCRVCGTPVRSEPVGRQRLFWCPTCQPTMPPTA